MQGFWKSERFKRVAFPLRRAALTRKTRFSMRRSRVMKVKAKSSAAEGEALQGLENDFDKR
jgi:hypothetical protein